MYLGLQFSSAPLYKLDSARLLSKYWVKVPAFLVETGLLLLPALQLVSGGVKPRQSQEEAGIRELKSVFSY